MAVADCPSPESKPLDPFTLLRGYERTIAAVLIAMITLGVMARATRYLQGWHPWGDETALIINVIERNYQELTTPLDSNQVAPLGYLWLTKAASELFGINELSLRLPAFLFSILALFAVVRIARACTIGWETVLAVGIFAVSNFHIRHAAEMKQYAVECGISATLLMLGIAAARGRASAAWAIVLLTPPAMVCSLTSVFIAGSISLALLPNVFARRSRGWWAWYGVFNAVIATSFLAIYFWILKPTLAVHQDIMRLCWKDGLPDWTSIGSFLGWIWRTATGSIFAHPFGGENCQSLPFAILFWVGVVVMWRRGETLYLRLLAGVFGLAILAALLGKFPLGGHPRVVLYLSPLVVLPMGVAGAAINRLRTQDADLVRRRGWITLGMLVAIGLGGMIKDLAKPYFNEDSRNLGEFARWFWNDYQAMSPGPLARVRQAETFLPATARENGYLHARNSREARCLPPVPTPDQIAGPTGLVICTIKDPNYTSPVPAWSTALSEHYDVFDHQTFQVNSAPGDPPYCYDVVWIRPPAADAQIAGRPPAKGSDSQRK